MLWLDPTLPPHFPNLRECDDDGLLAAGGRLDTEWLVAAYQSSLFPWSMPREPNLWWSPEQRAVFFLDQFHQSRSFKRFLKKCQWTIKTDTHFSEVVKHCGHVDDRSDNTWLSAEMESAYQQLYNKGWAHSIEVYEDNNLIGGVYGPVIPPVFCGESMFSLRDNGSKVALWAISRLSKKLGLSIIDAQIPNPHLESLGAQLIPRQAYLDILHSQNMEKADHWPSGLEYNVQELI